MKRPAWEIGLAALGIVLILASVLTAHWWTASFVGIELRIGLRSLTSCLEGECKSVSLGMGSSPFPLLATITWLAALATTLVIAASVALRLTRSERLLSRPAAIACGVVALLGLASWMWFPGQHLPTETSLSWGLPALLGGAAAAIAGEVMGSKLGGADGGAYRLADLSGVGRPPRSLPAGPVVAGGPMSAALPAAPKPAAKDEVRRAVMAARETVSPVDFKSRARHQPALKSVRPAAVDASAAVLRFVARTLSITEAGVSAETDSGVVELSWTDVTSLFVGQLPPDPPFEKGVFLDLGTAGPPVRVMQSTKANYAALPGGAAIASQDNFRRLALLIESKHAAVRIDPTTAAFVRERKPPRLFAGIEQLTAYDAQFQ